MYKEGRPDYSHAELDGVGDFNEGYGLGHHIPSITVEEMQARRTERALQSGQPVEVFVAPTNEQVFPSLSQPAAQGQEGMNILPDQLRLENVRAELDVQIARSYE